MYVVIEGVDTAGKLTQLEDLKNMFQKSLLIHSVLVKFVHIDQCEPIEGYLGIPFVTEINAVRVICLQFGRK